MRIASGRVVDIERELLQPALERNAVNGDVVFRLVLGIAYLSPNKAMSRTQSLSGNPIPNQHSNPINA